MQNLSPAGRHAVSDISGRYNISPDAVVHMLIAVNNGSGQMAQFNCPELGGSGQWMRGGMIMVGDMFNHGLKQSVDNLCNELSNLLANEQVFPEIPAGTPGSSQWWPTGLGTPTSSGSQNNTRYALFAGRLVVEVNGQVTVYDTLDHQIGGVSQQQGSNTALNFNSQYGTLSVDSLPVVSAEGINQTPNNNFASPLTSNSVSTHGDIAKPLTSEPFDTQVADQYTQTPVSDSITHVTQAENESSGGDIIALIEKVAQLHNAGVLSDEEFSTKKQELLARL